MLYDVNGNVIADPSPLAGMKLSLLGDSISAYAGTIPSGNRAYYTGSNSGVSSPNQMWWKVLCDKTGMIPLVINAWSGSSISPITGDTDTPMSDNSRCGNLGDGTTNPDIILIAGGVNDYSYASAAQNEPLPWDGKTAAVSTNSFTECYADMIKKIQAYYPQALVVALSIFFNMRGTDNGYTLTHTVGSNSYTQADYNSAIESVAKIMQIPFIRVDDIGMNRNNMYPTYAVDYSDTPTHPNAKGHKLIGEYLAAMLPSVATGIAKVKVA